VDFLSWETVACSEFSPIFFVGFPVISDSFPDFVDIYSKKIAVISVIFARFEIAEIGIEQGDSLWWASHIKNITYNDTICTKRP